MRSSSSKCCLSLLALVATTPAAAHGFGQRFDLPLPLWLWIAGAGATLVLTFVALALFARRSGFAALGTRIDLLRTSGARRAAHAVAVALRALAVALFLLGLAAGFLGTDDAYANLIVTLVWVIWWVGVAFVCALVGDLWEVVDPLRTLYRVVARCVMRFTSGRRESLGWAWPRWLGAWPAVALFLGFAWCELVWPGKDVPSRLAVAAAGYVLLTWAGMFCFGVEAWREGGDAFALAFRVLGRFAPLEVRSSTPAAPARLALRPYAAGLAGSGRTPGSLAVFVLLMLATVTFDGFHQTPLMERIETAAQTTRPVALALFALSEWGLGESEVLSSLLLLAFAAGFVAAYAAFGALMLRAAGSGSAADVAAMVWTLVPIAVAYHLSHYASLLLTTGQFIFSLASDPFGWGWNLFGTRGRPVDLAIVGPALYWYGAVALVVAGHVLSVVVAHVEALRRFGGHGAALRSQLPMVVLMVAYTSLSLWIMAQPIVG